jgi:hypothetical protein
MEYVILFRNPLTRSVGFIARPSAEEYNIAPMATFPDEAAARAFAQRSPLLRAWSHQVVALDEL